jgi:hypothetical protein
MAVVAPKLTDITPLANTTEVVIPSRAGDVIQYVFALEPGDTVNFTPDAAGMSSDIDLTLMTFGLDSALSTGNPITLNFQGVDVTATVSAGTLPFIQVPDAGDGSGLPGAAGDGSIIMQVASPVWTPAALTEIVEWFATDNLKNLTTSPDLSWDGEEGNNSWSTSGVAQAASYNATDKVIELNRAGSGDSVAGQSSIGSQFVFAGFKRTLSTTTQDWISSPTNFRFNLSSGAVWAGDSAYWNGQTDGSGGLLAATSSGSTRFAWTDGTTTVIPADTPFSVAMKYPSTRTGVYSLGGTTLEADYELRSLVLCDSSLISDADIQRLQGWDAWIALDLGHIATIGELLPTDHPYYAGRPLLTEGSSSSSGITVTAPVLTITFSNIPDTWEGRAHQGSQVLKHEQSITGGTFTFNPPPGEPVTYTFTQPGFVTQRFVRSITADQEIVIDIIPDPSYEA